MAYKFSTKNRDYTEWVVYESATLNEVNLEFDPIAKKLFDQDVFDYDGLESVELFHSVLRTSKEIPGVLVLQGNKTYGKHKRKFLYKCIPDDKRLPIFLVSYGNKTKGFSKNLVNKYILFQFKNWEGKHPLGTILNSLGTVDKLNNFYEYQLYCKGLSISIQKFNRATSSAVAKHTEEQYVSHIMELFSSIENRCAEKIFTIDPMGSRDFDDGFGIKFPSKETAIVSVYIANVSIWLEVLDLWDSFSNRISTIYFPGYNRPMLPTILATQLCSLVENETRFAFTMDMFIVLGKIKNITFCNSAIKVRKNYQYEDKNLLKLLEYCNLMTILQQVKRENNPSVKLRDSHDLVSYLMILMNYHCGRSLHKYETGIFRSLTLIPKSGIPNDLPENVEKFLQGWNSTGGQYLTFDNILRHDLLDLDSYVHITSPIRRLVDLLNMIQLQDNLGILKMSFKAHNFHTNWLKQLDYINCTMRSIRRIQQDCSLLDLCVKQPDALDQKYMGYVFDSIQRNDDLYQMSVYLPAINMVTHYISKDIIPDYTQLDFNLYLFVNQDTLKKKIRISRATDLTGI